MKKISTVFDYVISAFFVFIVFLSVTNYLFKGYFPLIISLLSLVFYTAIFFKVRGRIFLMKEKKSNNQKKLKQIETSLLYQTKSECLSFFAIFFEKIYSLPFDKKSKFLKSQETVVFPFFSSIEMSFSDLLEISKIARSQHVKHLIVPCLTCKTDTAFLSNMFDTISIFTSNKLHEKMIEFDFFPEMIDEAILPQKSYKRIFSVFLSRQKAGGFALIGLSLLAFSIISPFKIYYIISSSILLILSATLFLFKKR